MRHLMYFIILMMLLMVSCHKEFDYNYYAEYGGVSGDFALDRAIIKTFTTWKADFSYDLNSTQLIQVP